eukprot:TRINITY_DN4779_c0_g1_i1.p1 TRINITY_DN4779_c0_g1~~TRINITY_DN4779_c0_g1_i1.p1  ORF type:complete len:355 (-),score=88.89 TRINITY_DN4779_c0_g1_i1:560-1624(-)
MPSSFRSPMQNKPAGYQPRGVIGTFPNYSTPFSHRNNYSDSIHNSGILGHVPNHTRDSLGPFLGYRNVGSDSNIEDDSHLFQIPPQPKLSQPSRFQSPSNSSWNPRFPTRSPQTSQLDNSPFSLPTKESHSIADPYQQQHRSLPDFKLTQDPIDCYQGLPDLHISQSSINSTTSSELDGFPFISPKSTLPAPTQNIVDLSTPRKVLGEDQHLFNKYNLSTLLSDINVDSPNSIYSSGYSSIHESPNDPLISTSDPNSTPSYKPYRQEWIQVRSRELADKEVELNVREAYIKKKEDEYFMNPSSDKMLQELFDKELAKELQRGEITVQGYPAYTSEQDQLDPILSQIITNLHIDS